MSLDNTAAGLAHHVVEIPQSLENADARESCRRKKSC